MVRSTVPLTVRVCAACLALLVTPSAGRCDSVAAVSCSNRDLVRYDSSNPLGPVSSTTNVRLDSVSPAPALNTTRISLPPCPGRAEPVSRPTVFTARTR